MGNKLFKAEKEKIILKKDDLSPKYEEVNKEKHFIVYKGIKENKKGRVIDEIN